jgi:hypothetical protein
MCGNHARSCSSKIERWNFRSACLPMRCGNYCDSPMNLPAGELSRVLWRAEAGLGEAVSPPASGCHQVAVRLWKRIAPIQTSCQGLPRGPVIDFPAWGRRKRNPSRVRNHLPAMPLREIEAPTSRTAAMAYASPRYSPEWAH